MSRSPAAIFARSARHSQSVGKIGYQVLHVLDTHRESDDADTDTCGLSISFGCDTVRHTRRVLDQRVGIAETDRDRRNRHCVGETLATLDTAHELE